MATGGGLGRGGRGMALIQALKEKKKDEEKETERKVEPVPIPEPPKQQLPLPTYAAPAAAASTSQATPIKFPIAIGRGLLRPPGLKTPGPSEPSKLSQSPPKPSLIEEQSVLITAPVETEKPESQEAAKVSLSKLLTRGRGIAISKLAQPKLFEPEPEKPITIIPTVLHPPTETLEEKEMKSRLETENAEEEPELVVGRKPKVVTIAKEAIDRASLEGGEARRSMTSTEERSHLTTSSKSIEKAMEELKVEQITRRSPVRKTGESGQPTDFSTNYIKLKCKNIGVYQYVVHFDPPVDSPNQRTKLLGHCHSVVGNVRLFDGHTLFLPVLLKDKVTVVKAKRKNDTDEVLLRIQLTKILPPEQIPPVVFNIIFKNIMKELRMSRIGQHYFSSARQIDVPNHGLQIWPGYTTAVHEYEDGLYLVIDVAHKVLRSQTCWHLMSDIHTKCSRNPELFRQEVFNSIIGNIVLTKYNNRTYRIDDIIWDHNPETEFNYHNNEKISYIDYYKKHYDIEIRDKKQPLLLSIPKKNKTMPEPGGGGNGNEKKPDVICLIPELCFLTGMTEDIKNDIHIKKDLASQTRLNPRQRVEQLEELISQIKQNENATKQLTNWGLDLDDDLENLTGRLLQKEKIIFARKEYETDNKCDWTRPAGNEEVLRGVEINTWLCVYPVAKEKTVENFVMLATQCVRRMGIGMNLPITLPLRDDRADTYYNEIKKNLSPHIQMVMVIFPQLSDTRYTRVKKLCCLECPVPSQVICLKTISKPENVLKTVAQKILLQMNVKLGGELWRLQIPIKKLMIVGIDVYHKIEKKYKSIAGFVSSLNNDQTRWYSKVCFQMVGQELADTLKLAFMQSLKKYQEVNNCLPEKIIIFRDGVSEGQLSMVSDHEVTQLRSCFATDYCPQMSVIVVQKRISTRIFSVANRERVNPAPGAIIDHGITSKEYFDFFLVSQHVNQGTVTPTHYIVVYDDTQMKVDHVQRISYKMTHMYYNWSGTIRVPAPCQYAHKLAFLTGQYLQDEPAEALCNRLFYL